MHTSIESVLGYLDKVDPTAARRARHRYACFEHFSEEPQAYGAATTLRGKEPCEDEVVDQLIELQRKQTELMQRDGHIAEEGESLSRKMRVLLYFLECQTAPSERDA